MTLTKSLEGYGGYKKVADKSSRAIAVGAAISALLSVSMTKKPSGCIRIIC
jgi:hypothetical protein